MEFSEEELKQIFKIFKDETEEHLNNVSKALLELEKRPDDKGIISELFREAHSIKGSARMLNINPIQSLAHKAEDILGLAKDGTSIITPEVVDILCQAIDVISNILNKLDYKNLDYQDENAEKLANDIENIKINLLSQTTSSSDVENKAEPEDISSAKEQNNQSLLNNKSELEIILHYIKDIDNKFQKNKSINEILLAIQNIPKEDKSQEEIEILKLISQNLIFIRDNDIIPSEEIVDAISSSIVSVLKRKINDDLSLIMQRQKILEQILELSKENEKILKVPTEQKQNHNKTENKEPKNKNNSAYSTYETGNFKTLRVDTRKLDKLENHIEELVALKIKNRQNIITIDNLADEIAEVQKKINKITSEIKYMDKKILNTNINAEKNLISKNFQTNMEKLNEKIYEIHSIIDSFQKNIILDDTKLNFITDSIENLVKGVRILPLATIFHMFPRMVRDIARTQGKQVDIIITGSETTADKTIIEEIKSPLIHIIRNAIDHGIELPDERIQKGKNPTGKILLNSYHADNAIIIEITDNGRGLSVEKIKEKVLREKLLSQEELYQLNEYQVMNLIFWPGFTTGENVTEISGRGVGLDVVHTKISQLNGKISLTSEQDKGFKISIKIPITLATIKALLVTIKNQIFAISSNFIDNVKIINKTEILTKEGKSHINYNNTLIKYIKLSELLNIPSISCYDDKHNVVITHIENTLLAIEVDSFLRTEEILQKKLNPPLRRVKNISGVAALSSGETCLILNMTDLIKSALSYKELHKNKTIVTLPEKSKKQFKILVVDDSLTTLTMEKNILKTAGFQVVTATNGLEGLDRLIQEKVDVIVTDIEMPEMYGTEFIQKVRTKNKTTPIIVLTSKDDKNLETECLELGANDFLKKKDFSEKTFISKIKEFIY